MSVWSDVQQNLANLRLKAHIQHTICFIQNLGTPMLHIVYTEMLLLSMRQPCIIYVTVHISNISTSHTRRSELSKAQQYPLVAELYMHIYLFVLFQTIPLDHCL